MSIWLLLSHSVKLTRRHSDTKEFAPQLPPLCWTFLTPHAENDVPGSTHLATIRLSIHTIAVTDPQSVARRCVTPTLSHSNAASWRRPRVHVHCAHRRFALLASGIWRLPVWGGSEHGKPRASSANCSVESESCFSEAFHLWSLRFAIAFTVFVVALLLHRLL